MDEEFEDCQKKEILGKGFGLHYGRVPEEITPC